MIFRHLTGFLRKHGRISKGAQERSSSTDIDKKKVPSASLSPVHYSFPRSRKHVIVTLDPKKFVEKEQQCLHLGNLKSFRFSVALHNQSSSITTSRHMFDIHAAKRWITPPDTKAFLYYFRSRERPRISGELRLRVVPSGDPAYFESGSDLLRSNGQPWSRSLFVLSKWYPSLYEKLKEEQVVPHDLDAVLSTLPRGVPRSQHLYTLNDTFTVEFSTTVIVLTIITEQGVKMLRILQPFYDSRVSCRRIPYTGSALVRFERSTLPDHKGTRTVVLRFLKIITTLKCAIPLYDGIVAPPREGELHRKPSQKRIPRKVIDEFYPPVWSIDIDKCSSRTMGNLQLLWDT